MGSSILAAGGEGVLSRVEKKGVSATGGDRMTKGRAYTKAARSGGNGAERGISLRSLVC